jgi:hypothetical protein
MASAACAGCRRRQVVLHERADALDAAGLIAAARPLGAVNGEHWSRRLRAGGTPIRPQDRES